MYYSAIGILAIIILLIENTDILSNRNHAFTSTEWKVYRGFLLSVLLFYITDVSWGFFESHKYYWLLFADTSIYFIVMALSILFWTRYVVLYVKDEHLAGRLLVNTGRIMAVLIAGVSILNIFVPVLFTLDEGCVYRGLASRHVIFGAQILLLLLVSLYAFIKILKNSDEPKLLHRQRTVVLFGIVVSVCLFLQLLFAFVPFYAIAYMLGTCFLRAQVVSDEKEEYRVALEESEKIRKLTDAYNEAKSSGIIFTHIAQTLARGYEDLYYVNVDSDAYIEYHLDDESGSLKEIRRGFDFFESVVREAEDMVFSEDRAKVVESLDKDTLMKALDKNRNFIMTYRLTSDKEPVYVSMRISRVEGDENCIVLGISNVDDELKQRWAAERVREEHIAYARINALAGDYLSVFVVIPDTDQYREFSTTEGFTNLELPKEGEDFFTTSREQIKRVIHPDDLERFLSVFTKEHVLSEVERNGMFTFSYRLMMNGRANHVQLKAAMVSEATGDRLIVGVNDIESLVRQEEEYAKKLSQAQSLADVDALTGVKNRHAYLDEEERLDRMISDKRELSFAIVIMDVNDLKKVNDIHGHQAGDSYLRDACRIICSVFKRSPVFRVGGDEFAVIAQGEDYSCIEELVGRMNDHNSKAVNSGGIVIACGMSKYEKDECVATVFERADANMYENKNSLKEKS